MNPETKKCAGRCQRALPLSEFGLNKIRKDGRSPYCKTCVNELNRARRINLKTIKTARKLAKQQEPDRKPTAIAKVHLAIQEKPRTWDELKQVTKIRDEDVLSNATAVLYDTNQIRIQTVNNERCYRVA